MNTFAQITHCSRRWRRLVAAGIAGALACTVATAPAGAASPDALTNPSAGPDAAQSSVAVVMAQHADRELSADEMDKMRGGFLLFSSVAMDVRVEFAAIVNGELVPVSVDPSVFGAPGIFTQLNDGVATVTGTNQFRGFVTAVQNNLNFQNLQTATIATFDLTGSMASFRGGLMRSQLNATTTSLGL